MIAHVENANNLDISTVHLDTNQTSLGRLTAPWIHVVRDRALNRRRCLG